MFEMMLLGMEDTTWNSMKKFLGNRGVKEEILNFDAHRITNEVRKTVSKLLKSKSESFEQGNIYRVSVAAAPLAAWVKANVRYSLVLEKIQPLEEDLAEASRSLEASQARLSQCETELSNIDAQVIAMKQEFSQKTKEAEQLKTGLAHAQEILKKAHGLLDQLGGEQHRWSLQVEEYHSQLKTLGKKMLCSSGFLTFLAKTSEDQRHQYVEEWKKLLNLPFDFNLMKLLSTEKQQLEWKSMGLPSDQLSMENAIVLQSSQYRCPFIIDPTNKAIQWLQNHLEVSFSQNHNNNNNYNNYNNNNYTTTTTNNNNNGILEGASHSFLGNKGSNGGNGVGTSSSNVTVLMLEDKRFVNQMEQAVRFGKTVVIIEVDHISGYLFPLLRKELTHQGPRWMIQLGEKTMDYNENFRLYLASRHSNLSLSPNEAAVVKEINFTVTRSGLQEQLLGLTIEKEQPELEHQKSNLLKQKEDFQIQLNLLEKELLETLASSEGDILENTALILSLTKTKSKSAEIQKSFTESAQKSIELDEKRNLYQPFADKGSQLFFLIKQLQKQNPMYQFSLEAFLGLFQDNLNENISSSSHTDNQKTSNNNSTTTSSSSSRAICNSLSDRILKLSFNLEMKVLFYINRALFKQDQLLFALHLVHGMYPEQFQKNEWDFLLDFTTMTTLTTMTTTTKAKEKWETKEKKWESEEKDERSTSCTTTGISSDCPSWISKEYVTRYESLCSTFPQLVKILQLESSDLWIRWSRSLECEFEFHSKFDSCLTLFQKVLVVSTLRPDRLYSSLHHFVCQVLNVRSISPLSLDLKKVYLEETSCHIPILMITTAGADPSKELYELAIETIGKENYLELAMGGGQQEYALQCLHDAVTNGKWLCLQNLHLVISWLPQLEKEIALLLQQPHAHFRLWLTTESHSQFPLILLQQSLKITFESPPGIKKNIQRTFLKWNTDFFQNGSILRSQMLFLLAFFHSILQERRNFIPQGWTKFYDFSFGDLRAGTHVIQQTTDNQQQPQWEILLGLMENAIYGGRIDNLQDLSILQATLQYCFHEDFLNGKKQFLKGLKLPNTNQYQEYCSLIEQLPDTDSPQLFGLPENIEQTIQKYKSQQVLQQLKQVLNATQDTNGKFDRDQWKTLLSPILDLWERLHTTTTTTTTTTMPQTSSSLEPIEMFVYLEYEKVLELMNYVHSGFQQLQKVIYGTTLLTTQIQTLGTSLYHGLIPLEWEEQWEGPQQLTCWLQGLILRKNALFQWIQKVQNKTLLQFPIDLAELLNPATFLNAFRQQTARLLKCSMDSLKLVSSWEKDKLKQAHLVIEIQGLFLQGAAFEGHGTFLMDVQANTKERLPLPSVWIAYIPKHEQEPYSTNNSMLVPLYYTSNREKHFIDLAMPIHSNQGKWIMAGVALFFKED